MLSRFIDRVVSFPSSEIQSIYSNAVPNDKKKQNKRDHLRG